MQTTDGFAGLRCLDCDGPFDAEETTHRCPDCGGALEPVYEHEALENAHDALQNGSLDGDGLGRFAAVLPFEAEAVPTLSEGNTPPVSCPELAETVGVEQVIVKDEARNATGGMVDRELALAVTAASQHGASTVALPTTGNAGQAAAAYASRAGLDSESFVPSRTTFANKAMINVHGGEMNVVGGRYSDALESFEDRDTGKYSLAPFDTPYRHEGAKTIAYELFDQLETVPDAIVHPTGHGTGLVGLYRGFCELSETGAIETLPRLYVAQPEGCAPLVEAIQNGFTTPEPVERPDTISGPLEIPDPAGGPYVLEAVRATEGGAVAVPDNELLEGAVSLAQAGVPTSATAGAAIGGLKTLAAGDEFDRSTSVVLINPTTANRESDILRSHLMSKGI